MLSRAGLVGKTFAAMAGRQSGRKMSSHGHHGPPLPTMNDLPIPSGSWQKAYSSKQRLYNISLLISMAIFASTATYMKTQGVLDFVKAPPMKNKKD